jgi:hypothetical protein
MVQIANAASHNPQDIQNFLGPIFPKKLPRSVDVHSFFSPQDGAIGYVPLALYKKNENNEDTLTPSITYSLLKTKLSSDIRNHFETRLELAFQQMLLVYKTLITMQFNDHAYNQIGNGKIDPHNTRANYQAAHSSTIPALVNAILNDPDHWIVFAYGTYFYKNWNSTIYLPDIVNQMDSKLDRYIKDKRTGDTFREFFTKELNKVASGILTPEKALLEFCVKVINLLNPVIKELSQQKKSLNDTEELTVEQKDNLESVKEKLFVLNAYKKVAQSYKRNIHDNPSSFIRHLFYDYKNNGQGVNDIVYLEVQNQMHKQIKEEMQTHLVNPEERENFSHYVLQEFINPILRTYKIENFKKTANSYKNALSCDEKVRIEALKFFRSIPDGNTLNATMQKLKGIITNKTANKAHLPEAILPFYQASLEKIRSLKGSVNIRKLGPILCNVLETVGQKPQIAFQH